MVDSSHMTIISSESSELEEATVIYSCINSAVGLASKAAVVRWCMSLLSTPSGMWRSKC